jgi:hypothetical protein
MVSLQTQRIQSAFSRQKRRAMERYRNSVAEGKNQPSPWAQPMNQVYLGSEELIAKLREPVDAHKYLSERRRKRRMMSLSERKQWESILLSICCIMSPFLAIAAGERPAAEVVSTAIASSSTESSKAVRGHYDAVISVCTFVAPRVSEEHTQFNAVSPLEAAQYYFHRRHTDLSSDEMLSSHIALLKAPSKGNLVPDETFPRSVFIYHPRNGYLGADHMVFGVDVKGKGFKVIYSVWVGPLAPDLMSEHFQPEAFKACPGGYEIRER